MHKFFFLLIICYSSISAQPVSPYYAGASSISIDPGLQPYSLSLSGFAAPLAGRFSISWTPISGLEEVVSITFFKNEYYVLKTDGTLLKYSDFSNPSKFVVLDKIPGGTELISAEERLFLLRNNILYELIPRPAGYKQRAVPSNIKLKSASVTKGHWVGIDLQGNLVTAGSSSSRLIWKKINNRGFQVKQVTSCNGELYTLNSSDSIWHLQPKGNQYHWQQINRNNGQTSKIKISSIVALEGKLIAISEGKLYSSYHKTDNSLYVTTLAVKNNSSTILLLGIDLTGLTVEYINHIKRKIWENYRVDPSAIMINTSHTHFAPVTAAWKTWEPFYQYADSVYLFHNVSSSILRSVEEALERMEPCDISIGRGLTNIGVNRRPKQGTIRPYDQDLDVLVTKNKSGEKNVVFLAGCHPVAGNVGDTGYTISANFPGIAREALINNKGAKHAIFIQGCGGDINPKHRDFHKTGLELANDVSKIMEENMRGLAEGEISYYLDSVHVELNTWSKDSIQKFRSKHIPLEGEMISNRNIRWADLVLRTAGEKKVKNRLPVYIQTLNIGQLKIVGLSQEVVTDYSIAIKNIWPNQHVMVAGYSNGVESYLPNDWHINEGVYEGFDSFFWYGQPGLPIPGLFDKIINTIKTKNR